MHNVSWNVKAGNHLHDVGVLQFHHRKENRGIEDISELPKVMFYDS